MDALIINGGNPLKGELAIHGSKNAILPILAACILTSEQVCIHNVPHLADIDDMLCIMPVSYTHLDVYKRQPLSRTTCA